VAVARAQREMAIRVTGGFRDAAWGTMPRPSETASHRGAEVRRATARLARATKKAALTWRPTNRR